MRTRQSQTPNTRSLRVRAHTEPKKASRVTKPPTKTAATKRRTNKPGLPLALLEYHKQVDIDRNASIALFRLREIFDLIASHLPPEALICLSLSCKLALQYVGPFCWENLDTKMHYHARKNLMECLIRDAPKWLTLCQHCITMHPPLRPPRTHRETKLTKRCMSQWATVNYFPQVRDDEQEGGYSLTHAHIQEVFQKQATDPTATDFLSGNYATSNHPVFDYELASSASWVKGRLVLQHIHLFRPRARTPIKMADILSLPVRACPHHSTNTSPPPKSRYLPTRSGISPLLMHAIFTAFPPSQQTGSSFGSAFRSPTTLEQKQMDTAKTCDGMIWSCRACTTKFQVVKEEHGALKMTTWHCFGADLLHADKYWPWLVRREGETLGSGKRNSEFWSPGGRSVPDFAIAWEERSSL